MSGSFIGLFVDALVALLLVVTIAYCVVLNRRLKRLRADEEVLRQTIAELVQATTIAERAIAGLKETAAECDRELTRKLEQADRFSRAIERQLAQGDSILARLARISGAVRPQGLAQDTARRAPETPGERAA